MAKNPQKYQYHNVGIIRNSYTEQRLVEDAERHHMEEQVAKLIALRLTEYYELVDRGVIVPGAAAGAIPLFNTATLPAMATPAAQNGNGGVSGSNGYHQAASSTPTVAPAAGAEQVGQSAEADQNAEASLDIWAMNDGEEG